MARLDDVRLVLHIGLHKTATSYTQNLLGAHRYDLLRQGVLYPTAGTVEGVAQATREGAQSGHALFTKPGDRQPLVEALVKEIPETAQTVLMSSEDFTLRRGLTPEEYLSRFGVFGKIDVVLVLRRQDTWVESLYKQLVDQYGNFETRSLEEFVAAEGRGLLDFHERFTPWRDLVGPESFHVLSYDDLPDGLEITRRLLGVAGVTGPLLDELAQTPAPRYDSVRSIDTLGLRLLNSYRLADRDLRVRTARSIYATAPEGDLELMSPQLREGIETMCAPVNERIEAEWFTEPVPGLRFGKPLREREVTPPAPAELAAYVDRVLALCEGARRTAAESPSG